MRLKKNALGAIEEAELHLSMHQIYLIGPVFNSIACLDRAVGACRRCHIMISPSNISSHFCDDNGSCLNTFPRERIYGGSRIDERNMGTHPSMSTSLGVIHGEHERLR